MLLEVQQRVAFVLRRRTLLPGRLCALHALLVSTRLPLEQLLVQPVQPAPQEIILLLRSLCPARSVYQGHTPASPVPLCALYAPRGLSTRMPERRLTLRVSCVRSESMLRILVALFALIVPQAPTPWPREPNFHTIVILAMA